MCPKFTPSPTIRNGSKEANPGEKRDAGDSRGRFRRQVTERLLSPPCCHNTPELCDVGQDGPRPPFRTSHSLEIVLPFDVKQKKNPSTKWVQRLQADQASTRRHFSSLQVCVGSCKCHGSFLTCPLLRSESEGIVPLVSGNIPLRAGVSADRYQVSHAPGGGTIVTLCHVRPPAPVLIAPASSVSHLPCVTVPCSYFSIVPPFSSQ